MKNALLKLALIRYGLLQSEEGQDLVEYALLISLIALAAITGVQQVTQAITTIFNNISTSLA